MKLSKRTQIYIFYLDFNVPKHYYRNDRFAETLSAIKRPFIVEIRFLQRNTAFDY